jgi:U3 small nucleolar RNA-associated protein 18
MVKPAQNKRKTSKRRANEPRLPPAPLGSLNDLADEEGKDDEERRLESLLFGTPFVPAVKKNDKHVLIVADDDDDDERDGDDDILDGPNGDDAGRELENMLDQDVSFVQVYKSFLALPGHLMNDSVILFRHRSARAISL